MAVAITSTINLVFGSRVLDPVTGIILNDEVISSPYLMICHTESLNRSLEISLFLAFPMHSGYGQVHVRSLNIIIARVLNPGVVNLPEPGKRPLSSISPVVVEHPTGDVMLALGGSGGSRIFPAVLQVILNHLDLNLDVSQSVERPRVHDQLYPMETSVESTFWEVGLEELRAKGHNVTSECWCIDPNHFMSDMSYVAFDINMGVAEVQAVAVSMNGTVYAASDSRKNGIAAAY